MRCLSGRILRLRQTHVNLRERENRYKYGTAVKCLAGATRRILSSPGRKLPRPSRLLVETYSAPSSPGAELSQL